MQLFYAEKLAEETTDEWKRKKEIVSELINKKAECDAAVTQKQHEHKKVLKEVHKLENKTSEKVRCLSLSVIKAFSFVFLISGESFNLQFCFFRIIFDLQISETFF